MLWILIMLCVQSKSQNYWLLHRSLPSESYGLFLEVHQSRGLKTMRSISFLNTHWYRLVHPYCRYFTLHSPSHCESVILLVRHEEQPWELVFRILLFCKRLLGGRKFRLPLSHIYSIRQMASSNLANVHSSPSTYLSRENLTCYNANRLHTLFIYPLDLG